MYLVSTLKGHRQKQIPIWLMRQAGRYLPEYLKLRENFPSFIDFCLNLEAASEATMQPLRRFDLDAAIIFSDILILPHSFGLNVVFHKEHGPTMQNIKNIDNITVENGILEKVFGIISKTKMLMKKEFPEKSLIGFAGAPWTVACYMIEGRSSKDFSSVRKFCYSHPKEFQEIIDFLTEETSKYLIGQIKAGVDVIKIFDSWAGLVTPCLYDKYVINPTKKIVSEIRKFDQSIPIIGFPKGSGLLYKRYAEKTGVDCVAADHNLELSWIKENLQDKVIIQGNLDNAVLFSDEYTIKSHIEMILESFSDKPFVFNLGHGILPETPIKNVNLLIETVRSYKQYI